MLIISFENESGMASLFNETRDKDKQIFLCVKTSNNKMHKNANLTTFYSSRSVISFLFSGSIIVRCYNEHCIDAAPGNISVALV